jgi:hypothetical protein
MDCSGLWAITPADLPRVREDNFTKFRRYQGFTGGSNSSGTLRPGLPRFSLGGDRRWESLTGAGCGAPGRNLAADHPGFQSRRTHAWVRDLVFCPDHLPRIRCLGGDQPGDNPRVLNGSILSRIRYTRLFHWIFPTQRYKREKADDSW